MIHISFESSVLLWDAKKDVTFRKTWNASIAMLIYHTFQNNQVLSHDNSHFFQKIAKKTNGTNSFLHK